LETGGRMFPLFLAGLRTIFGNPPASASAACCRSGQRSLPRLKREMGPIAFSAQYQQSPIPPGGTIIRRKWLASYDEVPTPDRGDHIIMSWDIALSEEESRASQRWPPSPRRVRSESIRSSTPTNTSSPASMRAAMPSEFIIKHHAVQRVEIPQGGRMPERLAELGRRLKATWEPAHIARPSTG
jgi:hypothetical protein